GGGATRPPPTRRTPVTTWRRMPPMIRACLLALAAAATFALVACGGSTPYYDYSKEPNPLHDEYVIGVADDLEITVWKNGDLSTKASVRPDGTITLPLIGDVRAAGRTPTELKADIT